MARMHVHLVPSARVTGKPTAAEWYADNLGQRVEVYRNLHNGLWSVRRKGHVIGHTSALVIRAARFVVQPAGRERARREGSRNVHAFVRGILSHSPDFGDCGRPFTYSPFNTSGTFMTLSGCMVDAAEYVRFTRNGKCHAHMASWQGRSVVDAEAAAEAWAA